MKTFLVACMMILFVSVPAFASDPDYLIVEMKGDSCTGVGYEQGADLLKDKATDCTAVPSGDRLSGVKLMWMAGSRSDGAECSGTKKALCSGSTVPISSGASGTVCSESASGMYSSLSYVVSTTTCSSGKKAWKVTFTGTHYRIGGIQ